MAKIAIVGAGFWGPNLVRSFAAQRACAELTVCDKDASRLEWIGSRFPQVKLTGDFDAVLKSNVDGIVLATPVTTHYELARRALDAGKHVFVEKPLCQSVEEARRLVDQAERAGRHLMVGHTLEYSPAVAKVGELIRGGELGKIFFMSSQRVNLGVSRPNTSVVWELAPHDFSILFNWLDEAPTMIAAVGKDYSRRGVTDVAFISIEFGSGVVAHLEVSWLAPSKLRRTTVVGDKKMVVYDDMEAVEKVRIYDRGSDPKEHESFGEFQMSQRTGDILVPRLATDEPIMLQTAEFLQVVDQGRRPRTDGRNGLRVVEALAAATHSLEEGGVPVRL
ncbi:MAG: Gfo/Idh/MocA family protein [Myxococcota bacterium]|nr:Gfo/Idh/MocA family oxidoreductase [Myxococcota bacterium]